MSGADSNPDIKPSLTDAEISRFIALIDVDRLRSYNYTEDEKSRLTALFDFNNITEDEIFRIVTLFDPDLVNPATLTVFMIFFSSMFLFSVGAVLHVTYEKKKVQLSERCISLSRYSRTLDLKGLKDIGETYFAETCTVFRQESQDNFK
ncbi:uncharacterized protein LOC123906811 isoform X2 [Trifolium pratense]|uniref:uncharacterized protein LOC123906811 isoform X2 n=1 Tax=Trifolium pratense TaxID=57577 RepID=UPI001E693ECC|nr:uncharacterized protein LOC123906811 isoform X2 [Trifolium pratense]